MGNDVVTHEASSSESSEGLESSQNPESPEGAHEATGDDSTSGRKAPAAREVVVPLPVYKVVTVFSTLIAVVTVVAGFLALDAATRRATVPPSEIDPVLAIVGLFAIAAGGGVYAFASRFRAPGMGTPKTDDAEGGDDG